MWILNSSYEIQRMMSMRKGFHTLIEKISIHILKNEMKTLSDSEIVLVF